MPSKRFGVAQADKVRSVDDLSEFLINSAVTETEKITLEGIDHIVSLARFFLGATTSGCPPFGFLLRRASGSLVTCILTGAVAKRGGWVDELWT